MWRNFRIRSKMFIGFAAVLAVFAVSIIITWSLMGSVTAENKHIIDTTIPGQTLCSRLDESAYELFTATRVLSYAEDDKSVAEVQKRRAVVQKAMDEISAFYAKAPETVATAYIVNNVIPKLNTYFESIDQSLAAIAKKNEAFKTITGFADTMSYNAEGLRTGLLEHSKNRTQSSGGGDVDAQMRRLSLVDQTAKLALMVSDVRLNLLGAVASNNISGLKGNLKALDAVGAEGVALKDAITAPENRRMGDELQASVVGYKNALQEYIAASVELEDISGKRNVIREDVNVETSKALHLSEKRIMERLGTGLEHAVYSVNILVTSAVISLLLGVAVAFLISRGISKPLSTIVKLAKRTSDGDLTVTADEFDYEGKDELGELADAISKMILSQVEVMQHVISVANEVAEGAESLSAISEEANASMEEVKSSIDQVSTLSESNGAALQESNAGVEEMSAGADTVAQSATDSAAFISQTTEVSNRAIHTVNDVIRGMHDAADKSRESESHIKQLAASVDNVSSFVSLITGIADQTNLLALNAAIEAARAGNAGRGFAVVAEEVRKLAEESAQAAQNVNVIITELQNGARTSIQVTSEAGLKLADTLEHAARAQSELNTALSEMNKANDSIQNIAAVAEEQAASSKEVATAIDSATRSTMEVVNTISHIRAAADETAMAAQGVAEHSESMSAHAQNLTDMLSRFKLRDNNESDSGLVKLQAAKSNRKTAADRRPRERAYPPLTSADA